MIVDVLGCGPGIRDYSGQNPGDWAIGVNDIWNYRLCDSVLLMDHPESFSPDRLEAIKKMRPMTVYTNLDSWDQYHSERIVKIQIAETGGSLETLSDRKKLPFHVDSTFTAVCLAYHRLKHLSGDNRIHLYGMHFYGHHLMAYEEQILTVYHQLYHRLLDEKIQMFVQYNTSLLARVIPFLHHKF